MWPGRAAITLAAAFASVTLATWLQVRSGASLAGWDAPVHAWVLSHRVPELAGPVRAITDLASLPVVLGATLLIAAALALSRRPRTAAVVAGTVVVSTAVTSVVKAVTVRPRPPADLAIGGPALTHAFPSGHTTQGSVLAGLVAALLVALVVRRATAQVAVVAGVVVVAGAVGASRVYLGYHWTTDVLAGWSTAAAVLCLAVPILVRAAVVDREPPGPAAAAG